MLGWSQQPRRYMVRGVKLKVSGYFVKVLWIARLNQDLVHYKVHYYFLVMDFTFKAHTLENQTKFTHFKPPSGQISN